MKPSSDIYAGRRPEDVPAYPFAEAAALVGVRVWTLRSWVLGDHYPPHAGPRRMQPIVRLPKGERRFFSFTNLVEVHVLASIRRKRTLALDGIHRAIRFVHDQLQVDHLLADEQFKTNGVDLFVGRLRQFINPSRERQLEMRAALAGSLDRVEYDQQGRATRLFPLSRRADAPRSIVIDPRRAFGRPVLASTSVPTADVRGRFDAGDGVAELARDYHVSPELIEDALRATSLAASSAVRAW